MVLLVGLVPIPVGQTFVLLWRRRPLQACPNRLPTSPCKASTRLRFGRCAAAAPVRADPVAAPVTGVPPPDAARTLPKTTPENHNGAPNRQYKFHDGNCWPLFWAISVRDPIPTPSRGACSPWAFRPSGKSGRKVTITSTRPIMRPVWRGEANTISSRARTGSAKVCLPIP